MVWCITQISVHIMNNIMHSGKYVRRLWNYLKHQYWLPFQWYFITFDSNNNLYLFQSVAYWQRGWVHVTSRLREFKFSGHIDLFLLSMPSNSLLTCFLNCKTNGRARRENFLFSGDMFRKFTTEMKNWLFIW